ncbi:MAG TPA: SDR family oxidoreductase [Devosiaceae bacterium]|jgi:NAD(P)-dependent dehydrogenase (short-subunit alcohol dehydrogenase family)|nr:SDR family oxidoreductase [Devosiaceae bacterium]
MTDAFTHARLTGKIAIVTGAAQGIGEATARLFAARGIDGLLLSDRSEEKGRAVAKSLAEQGTKAEFIAADLMDPGQVAKIVPAAERVFGRLDILCNIAASTERGSITDTDQTLFDRIFAVNVRAPFFLIQDAVKLMQSQKIEGSIVNILSVNAHGGAPYLAPYSASKGALMTLTRNTAGALLKDRIRVNGLMLGWVDTPGEHATLKQFHDAPANWLEEAEKSRPFGRLMKPDEVARAVAYLASAESGLMTGSLIDFDQTVQGVTAFNPT